MNESNKLKTEDKIAFLQNNDFMGFVQRTGAELIIKNARDNGHKVEDCGNYFNVVLAK